MMRKVYKIPNMTCSACVMRLEGLEDDLHGILSIKASYHKQRLDIEYDENIIAEPEIRQAIIEMGYDCE